MDFQRIGLQVIDIIKSGCTWRGFKWRRASDTTEDRDCAIFHMDVDVKPGTIFNLSVALFFLRIFSKQPPDVSHSFFDYLNEQSHKGVDGEVRIVVRLEPRPAQPEPEIFHSEEEKQKSDQGQV